MLLRKALLLHLEEQYLRCFGPVISTPHTVHFVIMFLYSGEDKETLYLFAERKDFLCCMATFETTSEKKRFFITNSEDETFPIRFERARVVVRTRWGVNVVFEKTTRGQYFKDSREPKKRISADEVYSELLRLLGNKGQADAAFAHINIGK